MRLGVHLMISSHSSHLSLYISLVEVQEQEVYIYR